MAAQKCGAKTRAGGKCKHEAGWGTDHLGEGRCKLHGGKAGAPGGAAHPAFKHGLYAKHINDEDKADFEELAGRFDLANISTEELFIYYKLIRVVIMPGPVPPALLAKVLNDIGSWKKKHHGMLYGKKFEVVFPQDEIQAIKDWVISVVLKYVPEEHHEAVMNEFARGPGGSVGPDDD